MKRLLIANLIAVISLLTYFLYEDYKPAIVYASQGEEYKELMYQCDHAMREHYIAKMALEVEPSDLHIKNLQSSELGLMHCHEYDKVRKSLLAKGLSSSDLQRLGLEALEEKEYELRKFELNKQKKLIDFKSHNLSLLLVWYLYQRNLKKIIDDFNMVYDVK